MEQKTQETEKSIAHLVGPEKRYLTIRQRQSLNDNLNTNAQITQATADNYTVGGSPVIPPGFDVHKARLTQQAKDTLKVLKENSPVPLTAEEKDAILAKKKALEKEIRDNDVLETFDELHVVKRSNPNWVTATKKAQKRPQWEAKIQELKNCNLLLEPDNDYADSLDYLRRTK